VQHYLFWRHRHLIDRSDTSCCMCSNVFLKRNQAWDLLSRLQTITHTPTPALSHKSSSVLMCSHQTKQTTRTAQLLDVCSVFLVLVFCRSTRDLSRYGRCDGGETNATTATATNVSTTKALLLSLVVPHIHHVCATPKQIGKLSLSVKGNSSDANNNNSNSNNKNDKNDVTRTTQK
jgi:hypothetical protein